ncbi:NUDIX domain-containing protein [Glycomyces tritici]|uniref:NUDIX domain-containing protein n=1 Tax=Glycomyces tritici TaxID=2665176 RepID=A0ABT7YYD3_9ACTN|nr:NUDIX domain-containing protein [Glycomyces tritici]MDN3243630.1 NUDIX domain-containing protein [Glycomyces tritici]
MSIESETGAVFRIAARVIFLDQHDTVLHMGGDRCLDGVTRWITPGGGVEAGEDLRAAAVREAGEETGCAIDPEALVGPVAFGVFTAFPKGRLLVQKNWYFFYRTERFAPRVTGGDAYEQKFDFAWLPIDQCGAADGTILPDRTVALVKRLRDGDVPAEPVELGGTHSPRWGH